MASIYQKPTGKKRFVVSFRNPSKNWAWDKVTFSAEEKLQAEHALAQFQHMENCLKIGSDDWKKIFTVAKQEKTLAEIVRAYTKNFLVNKTNHSTIKRRNTCIGRMYQVFDETTIAANVRNIKRNDTLGWQLFKDHYAHLSRHTVNGYLTELRHMFEWAKEMELIDCTVINKHDFYTKDELPDIQNKVWTNEEVFSLLNHPNLTEYQKEFITIYVLTGLRVVEFLGHQVHFEYREFKWKHIDFDNHTVAIYVKRGKSRVFRRVHQDVIDVFKKWKSQGFKRPLDFCYKYLNDNILPPICMTTGIKFTMHDLRRLNAQLARPALGLDGAAKSIGDKTLAVVERHYAGISFAEMDRINDVVKQQLTTVTETATA